MTAASDHRPTIRKIQTAHGILVAEFGATTILLRPLRTRRGGPAEVVIRYGDLYRTALWEKTRPTRKPKVARGLLK